MASIRKQGDRFEIRECRSTDDGPRQRILVRFDRILTPEILDDAEALASRPFHRDALIARARARGIPTTEERRCGEARLFVGALRKRPRLRPGLVQLLRDELSRFESRPLPDHLEDAAEWLGASEAARGKALRGLLRTASRVARSRDPQNEPPRPLFPRISSATEGS